MTTDLTLSGFQLKQVGIVVSGEPTFEEWQRAGEFLRQCEGAVHWWIGDWLNYGEAKWGEMYSQALEATGYNYQTLANDKWIAGAVKFSLRREKLSFHHHKEIAALSPREQKKWLAEAEKNELSVSQLRAAIANRRVIQELEAHPLPQGKYDLIYADPPWRYDFSVSDSRKIENQYPTMEVGQICQLQIRDLSHSDCVLFLWATSPKLPEAMQVISAWGFDYKTCMIWRKDKIGMGYYARQKHELLLIATCGEPSPPPAEARPESVIDGERTEHSRKPEVFYELIERMYPTAKKVELFNRIPRPGWDAWGNEGQNE